MKNVLKRVGICFIVALLSVSGCITAYAAVKDYSMYECWWDEDSETGKVAATWDECESTSSYKLIIYRRSPSGDNFSKIKTYTISSSIVTKEVSDVIAGKGKGTYKFEVYPVKGGIENAIESEELEIDADYLKAVKNYVNGGTSSGNTPSSTGNTGWTRLSNGTWMYKYNGYQAKSGWALVNGRWYMFDGNGYMLTGWQMSPNDGHWYYLEPTGNNVYPQGACWINAVTPTGHKVDVNGAWIQ